MKYENPSIEILEFEILDVIRTSGLTGGDDDFHEDGNDDGNSTGTGGVW